MMGEKSSLWSFSVGVYGHVAFFTIFLNAWGFISLIVSDPLGLF
jgi:hypothetical protein